MHKPETYKIVVKKDTYDIFSADTEFYSYMDMSRLYYTFDMMIYEADREKFYEYARSMNGDGFVIKMLSKDGIMTDCYARIQEGNSKEQLIVLLSDIKKLIESERQLYERMLIQNKILERYEDDFFVYYPTTGDMKLISGYNVLVQEKHITINDFFEYLKGFGQEDDISKISDFIAGIKSGSQELYLSLKNKNAGITIKGGAVYDDGECIAVCGYLYSRNEREIVNANKVETDSLTGLLAKSEITNLATRIIEVEKRKDISIAIIDIDYFKKVNDEYGHMEGDSVLKKIAGIIKNEVGDSGVVGRFGGDEFFAIFYNVYDLEIAREKLRSIKNTVSATFPHNEDNKPVITLSIGCAAYPKDADNYKDLFELADFAVYRAKEKGRNRYIIYDKEKHGTIEEIRSTKHIETRINSRGDMSMGDILCTIMDKAYINPKEYDLVRFLDDLLENFDVQRLALYDEDNGEIKYLLGAKVLSDEIQEKIQRYIKHEYWQSLFADDVLIINDITLIRERNTELYHMIKEYGMLSCIQMRFKDKSGKNCILSLESVEKRITWNKDRMQYNRLVLRILSLYDVLS